jgi:lysophospholipase L1-like esterase
VLQKSWCALVALSVVSCQALRGNSATWVEPSDPKILVMGRVDRTDPRRLRIGYPGVSLRLRFEGTRLSLRAASTSRSSVLSVRVDGGPARPLRLEKGESELLLAEGLPRGAHSLELLHRTETWQGIVTVHGFGLETSARLLAPEPWPARRVLVIGDSVTCGEGIERRADCKKDSSAWNPSLSYGMLLAQALEAQCHLVCYGGRGLIRDWRGNRNVLNAPQFFDLAVPETRAKATWDHALYTPDVVLVSLGTNDFHLGLGALPDREEYVSAYVAFVTRIRARYPSASVLLTEGAIVSDDADPKRPQRTTLRAYLSETVRRLGDARVEFVESRYYPGDRCDPHPTREQHAAMARDLEAAVRRAAGW